MSQEVLKSVVSITQHWDYNKYTETANRANAATTNPVVEIARTTVLCLHCFGDNSEIQILSALRNKANAGNLRIIGRENLWNVRILSNQH